MLHIEEAAKFLDGLVTGEEYRDVALEPLVRVEAAKGVVMVGIMTELSELNELLHTILRGAAMMQMMKGQGPGAPDIPKGKMN